MNRFLIIGNGFDLAHKLPTRYSDFLYVCSQFSSSVYKLINPCTDNIDLVFETFVENHKNNEQLKININSNLWLDYFFRAHRLCYFSRCSRNQDVDYTDTEMDIHFGRIKETPKGVQIVDINENIQDERGQVGVYEGSARNLYRKLDNIKHIIEKVQERKIPKMKYGIGNWGLSIKTKESLTKKIDKEVPFGLVITLKEMFVKTELMISLNFVWHVVGLLIVLILIIELMFTTK